MGFWSTVMLIGFGAIFYIGWRGRQAFAEYIPPGYVKVYWAVFLFFAASFILNRSLGTGYFFSPALNWIGAYMMAVLFYGFLLVLIIDIARIIDHWLPFIPGPVKQSPAKVGLAVVILLTVLLAYGSWNAWHPVLRQYEISIPKNANGLAQVRVVMISDLHLGTIVNNERLTKIVAQINEQNPDLVLLAGDVIDGNIRPFVEQNMAYTLSQLKPRLGTYMVMGNHDSRPQELADLLKAAGITALRDESQLVADSFYVIGRNYPGRGSRGNRRPLNDIMAGLNRQLPIIMLDHSPANLDDARANGVDLQLSGHTHQGQIFPNNLITGSMYEIDWGYLQKDQLQVIVSTGVGTWGPPIRIGNRPEIVGITIDFNK